MLGDFDGAVEGGPKGGADHCQVMALETAHSLGSDTAKCSGPRLLLGKG